MAIDRSNRHYVSPPTTRREKASTRYIPATPVTYTAYSTCVTKERSSGAWERKGYDIFDSFEQVQSLPSPVTFKLVDGTQIQIPRKLKNIQDAILEAQEILYLDNDWDDFGACAADILTFKKAVDFVVTYSKEISDYNHIIAKPFIDIMRDGAISVYWETDDATLLVIFKKGNRELSYLYGEEKEKKAPFKYAISDATIIDETLSSWMTKHLI